jgi:hypothetical protein
LLTRRQILQATGRASGPKDRLLRKIEAWWIFPLSTIGLPGFIARTTVDRRVREGKPKGFFSITASGTAGSASSPRRMTPANIHDSIVYLGRLDRQRQRFDFDVAAD